jgi:hypothetical protein
MGEVYERYASHAPVGSVSPAPLSRKRSMRTLPQGSYHHNMRIGGASRAVRLGPPSCTCSHPVPRITLFHGSHCSTDHTVPGITLFHGSHCSTDHTVPRITLFRRARHRLLSYCPPTRSTRLPRCRSTSHAMCDSLVLSHQQGLQVSSPQSLGLRHTGKPTGVAVSHCITWFQTQPILSLRVRSATTAMCGIIVALDSSEP